MKEWRTKYDALYQASFGYGMQRTESPRVVCRNIEVSQRMGVPMPMFMLSVKRIMRPCWESQFGGVYYQASLAIENMGFLTPFSMDMIMNAVKDMLYFAQNGGDK